MDDNNPIKGLNDVAKVIGEAAVELNKRSTAYFSEISKSMAESTLPKFQFPDYSSVLSHIEIPINPIFETTEKMLEQIVILNTQLSDLHNQIKSIEQKQINDAKKNIRMQWTIGIVSAAVGAIFGGIIALLVSGR